ncbi:MAG TPA: glycosyltransferase [Bacteroidia bacterium]|nr:glycosyltransferase [Bacteroidia bacterium]
MTDSPKIVFLLVNYFNEKEACSFVEEQLKPNINNFIEIVITDNGSNNFDLLQQLSLKCKSVSVVKSNTNLGYFGAANLGLTEYLKNKELPDAVVICNTDIELKDNFFKDLQQKLASEKFDILGPAIYSTFLNYNQNPYIPERISTAKLKFLHFISSNYILYSLLTVYFLTKAKLVNNKKNETNKEIKNPYAVHGSFMVFNKSFFQKGGTINYPAVLFGEEIFIAEQARKLNLITVYASELKVKHHEHATTGVFKSRQAVKFLYQSYTYLLKTFFN